MDALSAFFFVKMDYYFGIGAGTKTMTFAEQLAAKLGEVINLSVVGNPNGAVFVAHRHVAVGRKVENGKAAATQTHVRTIRKSPLPKTGIVRATVGLDVRHPLEHLLVPAVR
jgi:hypothetical protein